MSGALRKMGVYLGLVEDGERYNARYDDELDDGYDDYEDEAVDGESHETESVPPSSSSEEQVGTVSKFPDRRGVTASPEVTELARITTVHPRSYNEARVIGEHFRDGTPVIMNLTEMDHADAKRLVDFASKPDLLLPWVDRADHHQGVPGLPAERDAGRGGEGEDRRGRVLQPELTPGFPGLLHSCLTMTALLLVLSVLSWVLLAFFLMLVARFVLSLIVMFAPQWHPKGPMLLLFELIYSVTDPFLRPLRRILPPIGAGGIRIDLSMLMLFVLVSLAMSINSTAIRSL